MPKPSPMLESCAGVRAFILLLLYGYATHWRSVGIHTSLHYAHLINVC